MSLDATKEWLSEMKKDLHILGPLLPHGYGTKTQNGEEGTSSDIETFLREMLVKHGERSVFYVGSSLSVTFPSQFTNELIFYSGFLWHCFLATSPGIRWRIDRCLDCKEGTICTFTTGFHAMIYSSNLLLNLDPRSFIPLCYIIGATYRKNPIIRFGNGN